jgi:hypothetical protein
MAALAYGESVERKANYVVQDIWDNHREMVRLLVSGWKEVDIARHLGVSVQTIVNAKNSPVIQRQIAVMRGARDAEALDVAIEIKNLAPKALAVLEELMENSPKDAVRMGCATDILDRAGFGAPKKIEVATVHLTKDDIEEMRMRMAEAGSPMQTQSAEDIIDAIVVKEAIG